MAAGFVQCTYRFITQHQMIQPEETVLVGVSGGVDSLALLYALHTLHNQLNCPPPYCPFGSRFSQGFGG